MIELIGKYNLAKVYTDNVEKTAVSQIINLLNQPFVRGSTIRIMPDVHAGAGCVIGFTADMQDMVIPNLIGVDIGCGMLVCDISRYTLDIPAIDKFIHENIPAGFNIRPEKISKFSAHEEISCYDFLLNQEKFSKALGTLGGGNHFIEIARSEKTGKTYLVIHTGSRNLGKQVADFHQKIAILNKVGNTPDDLCYLTGIQMENYLHDMKICQKYASENRKVILDVICKYLNIDNPDTFETVHNYVDFDNGIMRKGAVSAKYNERLIIPLNMRDGSLICIGKGNQDWNNSAPHGAGRIMSRGEAKRNITMDAYTESMTGIYTTCLNQGTIDESPMAYKPMTELMENIEPTVRIDDIVKPLYNFKAGGE